MVVALACELERGGWYRRQVEGGTVTILGAGSPGRNTSGAAELGKDKYE